MRGEFTYTRHIYLEEMFKMHLRAAYGDLSKQQPTDMQFRGFGILVSKCVYAELGNNKLASRKE